MRRQDREITNHKEMLAILRRCGVLRLGLCNKGRAYIVPMNFGIGEEGGKTLLWLHCAGEGLKLELLQKNPAVAFEADRMPELRTAPQACGWSAAYESVMGEGEAEIVVDEAQKRAGLDAIMLQCGFESEPHYALGSLAAVAVVKITVTAMTAKSSL